MAKDAMEEWAKHSKFVQNLSEGEREKLYEELKRSASVENPVKYTETHLEGGIEDEDEDKMNFRLFKKNLNGRWN